MTGNRRFTKELILISIHIILEEYFFMLTFSVTLVCCSTFVFSSSEIWWEERNLACLRYRLHLDGPKYCKTDFLKMRTIPCITFL